MKTRILYYDILRLISIIAVVLMHTMHNTLNTFNLSGTPANIYNIISQLTYFAVPMFIMISGSLFLIPEKELNIKKLYTKNILRIVICLFGFGMFYSILEIYFNTKVLSISMLTESIKNIFTGNLWAHMWYLYLILGLYMITPLLSIFTKNCTKKQLQYVLLILFIFSIILADITNYLKINIAFNILIANPYIFFYLLGHYFSKYDLSKKFRILNYAASLLSILIIILNNFINIFDSSLITYTCFITFNIIISIFLLIKNINYNFSNKIKQILISLSECTFGIYLIHQFIINVIYKLLKIDIILNYPYIGLLVYSIFIFITSYIIIYLLRKLKFIKKYIL